MSEARRSPTLRRRELGRRLRALRLEREMTVEGVAERLLCSPSKVSRMETGQRAATLRDIRDLCDLYEVTDASQRETLMELAVESKRPGWWTPHDLERFADYVGLEAAAVEVLTYKALIVPGLFQTEDYFRALNRASTLNLTPHQEAERIEVRMKRQERLTEVPPLRLRAVLDESVLRRVVGGPAVMAAQLRRLVEVGTRDGTDVTIQVIPCSTGAHAAMESTFNLLSFNGPEPAVVYVEGLAGQNYLDRPEEIRRYERTFDSLQLVALSPEASIELVANVCAEYERLAESVL